MSADPPAPFEQLDFLYVPSRDVAADVEHFVGVLGARLVFAIERFGTRVAMVELTESPPHVVLAGHLEGERPILVYRVADLAASREALAARGWEPEADSEIPFGPICAFRTPGGHRLAIYERTRPEMAERLAGRRDF